MRLFVAVGLPGQLKDKIVAVQQRLTASGADIKLVERQNLHFCLKFIGEVGPDKAEQIKGALKAFSFPAFDIRIAGAGCFPGGRYVRVVWLGVRDGCNELVGLAANVEDALAEAGIPKERRPFTPHLTLGRVGSARNKEQLLATLKLLEDVEIGTARVDALKLFQSELKPTGPLYTELLSVGLS